MDEGEGYLAFLNKGEGTKTIITNIRGRFQRTRD